MPIQNLGNFGSGATWGGKDNLLDLSDMHSNPGSHPPDRGPAQVLGSADPEVNGTELPPQAQTYEDEVGGAVVEAANPEN